MYILCRTFDGNFIFVKVYNYMYILLIYYGFIDCAVVAPKTASKPFAHC